MDSQPQALQPERYCCVDMETALTVSCDQHEDPFDCPDVLVHYSAVFDEYGLIVHDGGSSFVVISFCPWCGAKLPESRRDEWFDRLTDLGLEPDDHSLPSEMRSATWWREAP